MKFFDAKQRLCELDRRRHLAAGLRLTLLKRSDELGDIAVVRAVEFAPTGPPLGAVRIAALLAFSQVLRREPNARTKQRFNSNKTKTLML